MPGIQIVGPGNNVGATVNNEGRLRTVSNSTAPEYHINWEHELAFQLQFETTPTSGGIFLYVKNTDRYPLILENLFVTADADESLTIYRNPTGSPIGSESATPHNSNFGSNKIAKGVFQYGSDIGGLTADVVYNTLPVFAGINNTYTFRNWIIMTTNSTLCISATNGSILLDITMPFFYMPGEI